MVKLHEGGVYLAGGNEIIPEKEAEKAGCKFDKKEAYKGTIAYSILKAHNTTEDMENLKERFDAMTSHDITYVGIIQTARASGMTKFPIPYVLTCCHNSLCAVGGTINEDDHVFGLSAARKYGGIFVPPHMAVIHQYMRENFAGCGKMILGSDSHTRYGALGTLAIGEGGGELAKQLLRDTYDIRYPGVVCVYLTGKPQPGVGPHDIALAIEREVYKNSYVKNKIMEFVGPGVASMTTDFRNSVDVMTTETACLSSIWRTDEDTKRFLEKHHRGGDYKELNPAGVAYYDGCIEVDLSAVEPMIALPFHPSNVYTIRELNENAGDIFRGIEKHAAEITSNPDIHFTLTDKITNGRIHVQQGVIAGCAGGNYVNIMDAAHILGKAACGNGEFTLDVYPSSQPVYLDLIKKGAIASLMRSGAAVKTAYCGPCFGAGDTPANNALSIRHTTRNFPSREGSKPGSGQLSAVALMDARSIAATAVHQGVLTPATDLADDYVVPEYDYDDSPYKSRVYQGFGNAKMQEELISGPNIKPWPQMEALAQNILLRVDSKIMDEVTTTDELIPSGETSSYRSNPIGLAQFTLSRRDPEYVGRAKRTGAMEQERISAKAPVESLKSVYETIAGITPEADRAEIEIGSMIYCVRPGDGSAREQAASCQRVLGGLANICSEYATKRYRSNVMNWGMLPFQMKEEPAFEVGDYIYVPGIRRVLEGSPENMKDIPAYQISADGEVKKISLYISDMTDLEKQIVLAGCLINFNRNKQKG
jgi:aconitate hydratase